MVRERRTAIEQIAEEMCSTGNDTIYGRRIVEIIESTALDEVRDTPQVGPLP